ncbi:MAG: SDR family oxidoreductase [Pseudomonadota bacterium]
MNELPRAALVTGAAKRLGRTLALTLAGLGFDVALHCHRSRDEAITAQRQIERLGKRAIVLEADFEAVSADDAADRLVSDARDALGTLGVLVNNAGLFTHDRLRSFDRRHAQRQIDVNLLAPIELCQAFAAQLPDEMKGLIVNLTDARLSDFTPNYLSYSVAKAGLWAATQVLARDLAPNIRVNAIAPGPALPWPGGSDAEFTSLTQKLPLRHGPTTDEIGRALSFLVESPSITGQAIIVDGGQHMRRHV